MKAHTNKFKDIHVGDFASFKKTIDEKDLLKFASISGDYNPLHLDGSYALKTGFKKRIVHGMYLGALVSKLIGMKLPGKYALLIKESLEFKKPACIGDKLTISGEVVHKSQASRLLELSIAVNKSNEILACGSAHVRVLK